MAAAIGGLALPAAAQLTDLQPGRNFPTTVVKFGADHCENAGAGDLDVDGDLELVLANGGSTAAQQRRIFINQGGLQQGTVGNFIDETALRFAGAPLDRGRDLEFVDIEGDGDLDVCFANSGSGNTGGVSRFFVNQGALQGGTVAFFLERTSAWGTLVSVPLADQVFGGNQGPFREFGCDCDFADLDDDGALDLFLSTYGPGVNGQHDSRIFLNDGAGVFNELWPWANPGGDTSLPTLDVDLCDLEGDFDLDVAATSRDTQARIYINNLYGPASASPFQDVTQTAMIDSGAINTNFANYEWEQADLDGDTDFDLWAINFLSLAEVVLRNDTPPQGGPLVFHTTTWIKGQTEINENEGDVLDYDGDGDLDVFNANFSGADYLFQSGLAQGLNPATQGLYHRNGTSTGGGLAPWHELPAVGNTGTSWEGHVADLDEDGDPDIIVGNQGTVPTLYYENELGVPDAHAPTVPLVTDQGDKPLGTGAVIHASVRDNWAWYTIESYPTTLVYAVNGGPPVSQPMVSQGSQQFRGLIPGNLAGTISYHVESTDRSGNTGFSATHTFVQGGGSAWTNLGFALPGVNGNPQLAGTGTLAPGSANALDLGSAKPAALAILFTSLVQGAAPFKGGTLVPVPVLLQVALATNGAGALHLPFTWPGGVPGGVALYFQFAIADAAGPAGVALSNALRGVTP